MLLTSESDKGSSSVDPDVFGGYSRVDPDLRLKH